MVGEIDAAVAVPEDPVRVPLTVRDDGVIATPFEVTARSAMFYPLWVDATIGPTRR
jgi:hypothetical protein